MRRRKAPRRYTPYVIPPRVNWKIPVRLTRETAAQICEQLHLSICDLGGAAFYYPDFENNVTSCRYEFHHALRKLRIDARIGLVLTLGSDEVTEVEAYSTTPALIEVMDGVADFSPKELQQLQMRAATLLQKALDKSSAALTTMRHVVFHIEMPYSMGLARRYGTPDGRITFFPTRIVRHENKRLTAIIVSAPGASNEAAKVAGLRDVGLLCPLLTLATGNLHSQAYPQGTIRRQLAQVVAEPNDVNEDRLYPYRRAWPPIENLDPYVEARINWIWQSFGGLNIGDRTAFVPALLAYYAGSARHRDFSTLSIVAHLAALNSLASQFKEQCAGSVHCSICGGLSFRHNLSGDVAAITKMTTEILALEHSQVHDVRTLIDRTYNKQRSAYVHAAELRHHEYHQGGGLPPDAPSKSAVVQDVFHYQRDLLSLALLTRRVLLHWLSQRSGFPLDKALLRIERENVLVRMTGGVTVGLRGGIPVIVDHRTAK